MMKTQQNNAEVSATLGRRIYLITDVLTPFCHDIIHLNMISFVKVDSTYNFLQPTM